MSRRTLGLCLLFILASGCRSQTVSVVFSHDGSLLAAHTQEGTVYVWEANSGREVGRYAFKYDRKSEIPATLVHSLFFTPNDEWLVTTDQSGRAIRC
jgi:WD40 repeat protein